MAQPNTEPLTVWEAFSSRHPQHRFLDTDPLYALTTSVIDAIRKELPDFFSVEDEDFERDLARTVRHGFFLRKPIGGAVFQLPEVVTVKMTDGASLRLYDGSPRPVPVVPIEESQCLLARPNLTIGDFLDEMERINEYYRNPSTGLAPTRTDRQDQEFINLSERVEHLIAEMRGLNQFDIEQTQKQVSSQRESVLNLQEAYSGWLVTHPKYRKEVALLREHWGGEIEKRGSFCIFKDNDPSVPAPDHLKELTTALGNFYRRWCLQGLLTWDLPLPRDPMLPCLGEFPLPSSEEGVIVFIPWPLLKGGEFDLTSAIRRMRFRSTPEHLREWLALDTVKSEKSHGWRSFQQLFRIYRSFYLVLQDRYREKCDGHKEELDRAFSKVLDRGEDLVRKLRQRLMRSLENEMPGDEDEET